MTRFRTDFSNCDSTGSSDAWVDRMLVEIETHLPRMRRQCGARDFWRWFQGEAESMQRELLTEEAKRGARCRLDALLKRQRNRHATAAIRVPPGGTH